MLVKYKRNKKVTYYDPNTLITMGRAKPDPRPSGPFGSCIDCPYASHGFICYSREGDCMRTYMARFCGKGKSKKEGTIS